MNDTRRLEKLAAMLRSRTNSEGEALPGYKSNVAQIKAEMAQLQENMGMNEDGR